MIYGSICSGIEAATCAWHPLGWKPAFFAEIDPFCGALLKEKYPEVPNYGDFTKITSTPPIDLLVGGTPCQSFSVAGKRGGLDDPRGVLAFEFLRLASRLHPRWLLFENVPGMLSSNKGEDFGAFLYALGECGYGFAYRVLDAQFTGVAQRRQRVFVVGYLGDWLRAAAVLFDAPGMRWNPPPSREKREAVAGTIGARTKSGGGFGGDFETSGGLQVSNCLNAHGGTGRINAESETFVAAPLVPTLTSNGDANSGFRDERGGNLVPGVIQSMAVRRLTPVECERLQGFPDNYTLITYRNKPACDGNRYKAIGNSMAVTVMHWLGKRIQMVDYI